MTMLTLNDVSENLKDVSLESILFSAVPKPDVDFVTDIVRQLYDWISKSADVEDFFANLVYNMSKEKISKIELLTRGQKNNELWYNYRKGVITASKAHSIFPGLFSVIQDFLLLTLSYLP